MVGFVVAIEAGGFIALHGVMFVVFGLGLTAISAVCMAFMSPQSQPQNIDYASHGCE